MVIFGMKKGPLKLVLFLIIFTQTSLYAQDCDDYFTNEWHNPIDMNEELDINNYFSGIDVIDLQSASFSNGIFSATTGNDGLGGASGSTFYLWSPMPCGAYPIEGRWGQNLNLDRQKYSRLVIRIYSESVDPYGPRLIMDRSCNYGITRTVTAAQQFPLVSGWQTVVIDLNSVQIDNGASSDLSSWASKEVTGLAIMPTVVKGNHFKIDWIRLEDPSSCTSSYAPYLQFENPDKHGGEAFLPWNMRGGDFIAFEHLSSWSYLDDSQYVDGLRGNFFKGVSTTITGQGAGDPQNISIHVPQYSYQTPIPSEYRNLCYKLFVDRAFSLGEGSVARVVWWMQDWTPRVSEDLPLIYNNWSSTKWYEYCVDMTKLWLDGGTETAWYGDIVGFRVDPHEFNVPTNHYFDYIKLRKDYEADGSFAIVYNLTDPDSSASVNLFYSSAASTVNGVQINIGGSLGLDRNSRVYTWDTSQVPEGTYYIYGVASDGQNTTRKLAAGRVVVKHDNRVRTAPVLYVESPTQGLTYCNGALQVKGYALQSDRNEQVAAVEVLVNDQLIDTFQPREFAPKAVQHYPNVDSSNTGFNNSYDVSAFGAGVHTVLVKAYGNDGQVSSSSYQVNFGSSNCAAVVADGEPGTISYPAPPSFYPGPGPSPVPFGMSASLKRKSNSMTISFSGGCSAVEVSTAVKKANLWKRQSFAVYSGSTPLEGLSATKLKKLAQKSNVFFQAKCLDNSSLSSAYRSKPYSLSNKKQIKKWKKWVQVLKNKLSQF